MFYVLSPSVYLKVGKSKGGAFINMVMNFGIPENAGNFFTFSFSRGFCSVSVLSYLLKSSMILRYIRALSIL